MIINVGGRTDIVNYYTPWLINRINEEYVYTRNPYNKKQITKYSLKNSLVDALIFCSKNYKSILDYMPEITRKYPIQCHYTITCYEKDVEPLVPPIDESIKILKELSEIIGKKKLSWRYDPILITEKYTVNQHIETFEYITQEIHDNVSSCIFSFIDMYSKVFTNMPEIIELDIHEKEKILKEMSSIAKRYNMPLQSCAVGNEYAKYGIIKSGCVTTKSLEKSNNIEFSKIKHTGKRKGCNCIDWRDIGEYNTCINGCKYCYANKSQKIAKQKYKKHDPNSPILIGHIEDDDCIINAKQKSYLKKDLKQQRLI